jgi:hypothetical protein
LPGWQAWKENIMAEDRNLRVQETDEPIPEPWELDGPPIRVPDEDDALFAMVLDLCTILRRVGGVAKIAAVRREVAPGTKLFETVEYAAAGSSYAPSVKSEPVQNGEATPVEAGQ